MDFIEDKHGAPKQVTPEEELELDLPFFYKGILKVEKLLGFTPSDGAVWRFEMFYRRTHGIIEIANEKLMVGPGMFNNLFKSRFGIFLPHELTKKPEKGEPNLWIKFQLAIENVCTVVEPEESTEWIETDRLIENMAKFMITEDNKAWYDTTTSDRCLLKIDDSNGETFYCVKSDNVASLMKDIGIKMPIGRVSDILNTRNIKKKGNPRIRVGEKRERAWWISNNAIDHVLPSNDTDDAEN
jgi:hypothetical protein